VIFQAASLRSPSQETDHEEGRKEGQFVEGVEEEEVGGEKGSEGAGGDEEGGGIPEFLATAGAGATEEGGDGDDDTEEDHHDAHAIVESELEMDGGFGQDEVRKLRRALAV